MTCGNSANVAAEPPYELTIRSPVGAAGGTAPPTAGVVADSTTLRGPSRPSPSKLDTVYPYVVAGVRSISANTVAVTPLTNLPSRYTL